MGQTKYCWQHGPGAWMHHKDLLLPDSLILLQNKLSLHCFDSVPRLSCSLSPTQTWLAGLGSRCIPGPAYRIQHFLNFSGVFLLQDLVLFACFPLQLFPHPLLHSCIFPSKASTVLPSSAVLSSTLFSSTNPKTACTPVLFLLQWCLLSTDPCSHQQFCPRVCIVLPKLCDLQLPHVFPFPKLLLFILHFGSGASMAALGSRPAYSCAGSGLLAELLWVLLNQSFPFIGH